MLMCCRRSSLSNNSSVFTEFLVELDGVIEADVKITDKFVEKLNLSDAKLKFQVILFCMEVGECFTSRRYNCHHVRLSGY